MLAGYIRGQELRISTPEIAADSIKYLEAEFHFAGRDWDGYVKTAYFINGASKFALALADDRITADMGLNLTAGEWAVKLSGVKGDSRITTTTERIYVREFGGTEGTLPDVTPTEAEQLLAKIGDMSALETEAKNSLVAAINEAAKSGGGSGGKDGTGIESITYKGEDESGGNVYTVLLTDGTSYDITAPKGAAGITPHIGDNGNWYLGTTDTGKPSRGEKGEDAATDLSLGLTGATAGQIAKIAAVDASGVPTAWSPVDMPSGGGGDGGAGAKEFRLVNSITLDKQSDRVDISVDSSGNTFALHEVYVMLKAQSYEDATAEVFFVPNGRWGAGDAYITSANRASKASETWKNNMTFHAVYADGIICNEQLPAKSQNQYLTSAYASNQAIITKISLVCKFAAGCTFLVIGR